MLTEWLADRRSYIVRMDRSFRPCLESLEQRNAPSGHGPGGDHDHGPPPPPPANNGVQSNVNAQGSFNNSTITDSFNNTINVAINLPPTQSGAVGGLLGISDLLASVSSNPQLGSLLNDEIALAVDNYLTGTPAIASVLGTTIVTDLKNDAATLTTAIAANPLESSPAGAAFGTLVYDLTFDALTGVQPKI